VCYFHNVFRFVFVCNVFWAEFQRYCGGGGGDGGVSGGGGGGGGGREEEVSLGVIITNTEIKFHILLFALH
jgi:hypothetical protein